MSINKDTLKIFRDALYHQKPERVREAILGIFAAKAKIQLCFPFETLASPSAFADVFDDLIAAMPDLERRDHILIEAEDDDGATWLGCGGFYCGQFLAPWLDIPPTGHLAHMRFHEFYRMEGGKVTEVQAIWDIPELMMQAGAWPMAPSLGREWHVPAPASQDGLGPHDKMQSAASRAHVIAMLEHLIRYPSQGGPEVMALDKFWHPRMNWYGPSGIGTARGIEGFRNWHQIPFLNAMPDRGAHPDETHFHFMAEGDYVGVTGWPDMVQTITHDGWMGIAPSNQKISMRSLDFWRLENGLIRENWVLLDMLSVYHQLGVDVLARMREFNKARSLRAIDLPYGKLS